jgi:hypothetical protein
MDGLLVTAIGWALIIGVTIFVMFLRFWYFVSIKTHYEVESTDYNCTFNFGEEPMYVVRYVTKKPFHYATGQSVGARDSVEEAIELIKRDAFENKRGNKIKMILAW